MINILTYFQLNIKGDIKVKLKYKMQQRQRTKVQNNNLIIEIENVDTKK